MQAGFGAANKVVTPERAAGSSVSPELLHLLVRRADESTPGEGIPMAAPEVEIKQPIRVRAAFACDGGAGTEWIAFDVA